MSTVGLVHAEKEGRTTGEKEAIPTLTEHPRMDTGGQRWCGPVSCAREWVKQVTPPAITCLGNGLTTVLTHLLLKWGHQSDNPHPQTVPTARKL